MSSNEHKKDIDDISGIETTGHEWDGIKELNNPLPRWWVWIFYATIVFSIGYVIWYPSIPLLTSNTQGVSGYSSRGALVETMAAVEADNADLVARIAAIDVTEIANDRDLLRFAVAGGRSAFKVYCSQCHGSGAAGSPGFPNLNDDYWLWGGSVEAIHETITYGIRHAPEENTRYSEMPAFGRDELISAREITDTAHFVRSLSDLEHDAARAAEGAVVYADQCASCHGDAGLGDQDLGAPNLADAIWHYGKETSEIAAQIHNPKHGVMPAWGERLGDVAVKRLTLYVHSLGGGE